MSRRRARSFLYSMFSLWRVCRITLGMDFSEAYPLTRFDPSEYVVNSKLKVHKQATLLEMQNIKSSGRVLSVQ